MPYEAALGTTEVPHAIPAAQPASRHPIQKITERQPITRIQQVNQTNNNKLTSSLASYADADHAADKTDHHSMSGIVHLYNNFPVSWTSKKQSMQALSTCEAEYIAATTAVQETQRIRGMLGDIAVLTQQPTPLHIDNQSAILTAKNRGHSKRRSLLF